MNDKDEFYFHLNEKYKFTTVKKPWNSDKIEEIITLLKQCQTKMTQEMTSVDKYYSSKYGLLEIAGKTKIILKTKTTDHDIIYVTPIEEFYDKISEQHLATGHGGRDKVLHMLKKKYNIPKIAVEIFIQLCQTCNLKKKPKKKNLFGHDPKIGLLSTDLPTNLIDNISTDEDLQDLYESDNVPNGGILSEELLDNVPIVIEETLPSTSNDTIFPKILEKNDCEVGINFYCSVCGKACTNRASLTSNKNVHLICGESKKDSDEQIICYHCLREEDIITNRIKSYEGQLKASELMENKRMNRYMQYLKRNASQDDPLEGPSTPSSQHGSSTKYSLPYILDGEFFEPLTIDEISDRVTARCQTCHKIINGSGRSTGNWRSHINRLHPELIDRVNMKSINRKMPSSSSPSIASSKEIINVHPQLSVNCHYKAIDVNAIVKDYIINEMIPLETIDSPHFLTLLTTISRGIVTRSTIVDSQKLQKQLEHEFNQVRERLINMLSKQKYYCLTVDNWKYENQNYLGVSIHTIEPHAYERLSNMLIYRKNTEFVSLNAICKEFCLDSDKISNIITHNLTNLPKDDDFEYVITPQLECDKIIISTSHILHEILNIPLENIFDSYLSASSNENFKIPVKCFKKLTNFWNLKETQYYKKIKEILNTNIIVFPEELCGFELFKGIKFLILYEEKLSELFLQLNIIELKPHELEFLKEFIQIYEICNSASDILHNDKNNFLGVILPTFIILEYKLKNYQTLYSDPMINLILLNIKDKFLCWDLSLELSKQFILASISHPKFKLSWIPVEKLEYCKNLFIQECKEMYIQEQHLNPVEDEQSSVVDDEFFRILSDMNNKHKDMAKDSNILKLHYSQALSYFDDKRKLLDMLENYNIIKKVFMKYNTCIATSTNVQKIFCKNNKILTSKQTGICENIFENMLFLKSNTTII